MATPAAGLDLGKHDVGALLSQHGGNEIESPADRQHRWFRPAFAQRRTGQYRRSLHRHVAGLVTRGTRTSR